MRAVPAVALLLLVAGCGSEHGVFVIDTGTGAATRVAASTEHAAWLPDGRVLVADDDSLKTFTPGGERTASRELRAADVGSGLGVSRDGRVAAIVAPEAAGQVNGGDLVIDGERVLARAYGTPVWSRDGRRLAVLQLSATEARDEWGLPATKVGQVLTADGRPLEPFRGDPVQFLPDGSLVTLRAENDLFAGPRKVADDVTQAAVAPDGSLAMITTTGVLRRTEPGGRGERTSIDLYPHSPVWSPDGRRLAMLDDGRVLLMDTGGETTRELTDLGQQTFSGLSWSPDGRRLLVVVDEWVDPD